jgi:hypothetical protein
MNKSNSDNILHVVNLYKVNTQRKRELGGRVQVLRVALRNFYFAKKALVEEYDFILYVEAVMDNLLAKYHYKIEDIIERVRAKTIFVELHPLVCEGCKYRPPFCRCKDAGFNGKGNSILPT